MASIQQLSVSALFYSLSCNSSSAAPATVIQFISSTASLQHTQLPGPGAVSPPHIHISDHGWNGIKHEGLSYLQTSLKPQFSAAVSVKFSSEEILLWVWTVWVTHSTPELCYSASIWSKISVWFRVTVTSNSHQPFAQEVGVWWEM